VSFGGGISPDGPGNGRGKSKPGPFEMMDLIFFWTRTPSGIRRPVRPKLAAPDDGPRGFS
jgi:hypothetical protein